MATTGETTVNGVTVVDAPEGRVRQARDGIGIVITLISIGVVLGLAVFAQQTTAGVTADVQSITAVLRSIFQAVVTVLMNLATIVMPGIVLIDMLIRRQIRLAIDGAVTALAGYGLAWGLALLARPLSDTAMVAGLTVGNSTTLAIPPLAVATAALLTSVGPRSRRSVLTVAWNLLGTALVTDVLTSRASLPAAVLTVFLGRLIGQIWRYAFGVAAERATPRTLVEAIERVGIRPVRIARVRDITDPESPTIRLDVRALRGALDPQAVSDSTARLLERRGGNRVYAVFNQQGERWDMVVLDADRQVVGWLQQTWRTLRLRGMDRRSVTSLRQAAERAALLNHAAASAGVRTPQMVGVGEAGTSMILVQSHPAQLRALRDMRSTEILDTALVEIWQQLANAHTAGLAHRAITSDCVLFDPDQTTWLVGWESGDVASSDLARRLDLTQMLATLALKVGAVRAVASAAQVINQTELAAVAPLLQTIALPSQTRAEAQGHREVLEAVREALVDHLPHAAQSEPFRLVRFGWRTVLLATITIIALWVVLTRMNFDEIVKAVGEANPLWMAVAMAFSLATYAGAAMAMVGFTPAKLRFRDVLLTQVASSFVALAAPAGMGPAALNLRMLTKKKVPTSLAVATVALVQAALFAVTITMLVVISLATGDSRLLTQVPATAVLIVIGAILAVGALLAIPKIRSWVWGKIQPTFGSAWPRLVWVLGQPKRLALGLGGHLIQSIGYVLAFWSSVLAFGVTNLSPLNIALIYCLGNTAGSAVPTPGGLGAVEFALTTGLTVAGLTTGLAASIAVLFRAVTYWARVPLGWIAWRYLQNKDVF
ncbi:MAG: flippase-like domain-containing protein [Bifidobacteriaceae bacterium]|nr:flippase-like domain-containing protein [Bifidobacteriaceae bacterium]